MAFALKTRHIRPLSSNGETDDACEAELNSLLCRLVSTRGVTTSRYMGSRTSQIWEKIVTMRNKVDKLKNQKAARVSALYSSSKAASTETPGVRIEAEALITCTALTTTPTAACPDITGCIACGPNSEATAITAVWRYDPAEAWSIPLMITKAKKTPGATLKYVDNVKAKTKIVSHNVESRTRREEVI